METFPLDLFDMSDESNIDVRQSEWSETETTGDGDNNVRLRPPSDDHDVSWLREDLPATTVDVVDVPARMLDTQLQPLWLIRMMKLKMIHYGFSCIQVKNPPKIGTLFSKVYIYILDLILSF